MDMHMEGNGYIFLVCKTPDDFKFAQQAEITLIEGLGNNILEHLGSVELGKSLKIFLRDHAGNVVGGVIADCFGGWVYISLLWVQKSLRNLGYGTQLMQMIESEAIQLGCTNAHVDTYSYEARPFYEKLGYELFATLDDYPKGFCKYFLKKRLVS
jgi:GNAT superfamily N-acetyltransferase